MKNKLRKGHWVIQKYWDDYFGSYQIASINKANNEIKIRCAGLLFDYGLTDNTDKRWKWVRIKRTNKKYNFNLS